MRALALSGQRNAALAQYQACRRVLAQELGAEPTPETGALRAHTGRDRTGRPRGLECPPPRCRAPPAGVRRSPSRFVAREMSWPGWSSCLAEALAGRGASCSSAASRGAARRPAARVRTPRHAGPPRTARGHGTGNAYTGLGDPYLPFLEVLQMLTGDIEAPGRRGAEREQRGACGRAARRSGGAARGAARNWSTPSCRGAGCWAAPGPPRDRAGGCRAWRAWTTADPAGGRAAAGGLFEHATCCGPWRAPIPCSWCWTTCNGRTRPLSLLFHLGRRLAGSRILVVGAYRPDEVAAGAGWGAAPPGAGGARVPRPWGDA